MFPPQFLLRLVSVVALLVLPGRLITPATAVEPPEKRSSFELHDGDRIVLLGDTFFERAQRYGWLETTLQGRHAGKRLDVRNLGWSGDTVFAESRGIFDAPDKGYARMIEQVTSLKPTLILLHYGNNESFRGTAAIDAFLKQYEVLLDDLAQTGARQVLISPVPLFPMPAPLPSPDATNAMRREYVTAVAALADKRSLHFVDLWSRFEPWTTRIPTGMTDDGVHLTDLGYQASAEFFVDALCGADCSRPDISVNTSTKSVTAQGCDVEAVVFAGNSVSFNLSLPAGVAATGIVLNPTGMEHGRYKVRVEDRVVAEFVHDASGRPVSFPVPSVRKTLCEEVIHKNIMYFHSWRPQNVTYLFLFRKHEQGQNAKEVDEFAEIVAGLDENLARSKQRRITARVELISLPLEQ